MPPPATESKRTQDDRYDDRPPEDDLPIEVQARLQRLQKEAQAQARLKEELETRARLKEEAEARTRIEKEMETQELLKKEQENQARLKKEAEAVPEPIQPPKPERRQEKPIVTSKTSEVVDNVTRVPDEELPSHRERQRWDLSKRFLGAMDELLPKLALVTQKVNTYTGTDYSAIEALRMEIKDQEKLVKARRLAIETSKEALDDAQAQQAASQKEVVALLERKHSWSSGDLERYMSLIRSEHINDRAVRKAKEAVAAAEDALEEARRRLEKRERAQYHEEQIWSDTIRRNSTWVTFGLMGVNIFLLLLSLVILEPWRRRRMVREIKSTLEAQKTAVEPSTASLVASPTAASDDKADSTVEPTETTTTGLIAEQPSTTVTEKPTSQGSSLFADAIPESIADLTPDVVTPEVTSVTPDEAEALPQEIIEITEQAPTSEAIHGKPEGWQERVTAVAQDIISERAISMRRIDFTTAILQSAAAGAVVAAALIAMLKPY
ncbi:hypothetical protein P153DRAFT_291209 [Dothidotthia symphoricarpi CBS 119687]|uniref:Sensitive to high expression protein 9, mitochondrial n=1 Tax=Dothidotthia symphoricarpi CBS 119687 TaxID=1392245 RepID=A0A6A6ACT3_9PLEO|nr:uncharacterized protein P153DRAFT_291209 [Dothidotthia symphoricarpi CBS 119687]KAF2129376.1 hypothetical protein P153DRAFT_291209 [Dothidotthia symphoricarpi CBS 119687]